jgi:hypothetical protein
MARDAFDPGPNGDYPAWPRRPDGTPDPERMPTGLHRQRMPDGSVVVIDLTPRDPAGQPIDRRSSLRMAEHNHNPEGSPGMPDDADKIAAAVAEAMRRERERQDAEAAMTPGMRLMAGFAELDAQREREQAAEREREAALRAGLQPPDVPMDPMARLVSGFETNAQVRAMKEEER